MATNDDCLIKVDKATYENVVVLLKALQPSVLKNIKSFQHVLSDQLIGEGDQMLCNNIFMVSLICKMSFADKLLSCIILILFQAIVKKFCQVRTDGEVNFILHEISPTDGMETGTTFSLTLCEEISSDWLHGPTINCFSDQKFVLIFQSKFSLIIKPSLMNSNVVHFF